MKVIFSGLESSGKSLKLAMMAQTLVLRNSKWNSITGLSRPIVSNMAFSDEFKEFAASHNVEIKFWKDLSELVSYTEADIICDEVGNYLDSRKWADLTLDVKQWLTQGAKQGIEFYGGAQDFAQVDKAFRRLVQRGDLIHITKLIGSRRPAKTKPAVKRVWGVCFTRSIDPRSYDEDDKVETGFPLLSVLYPGNYFLITKSICNIFDTGQKIQRSTPPRLRHVEQWCELDNCSVKKLSHV